MKYPVSSEPVRGSRKRGAEPIDVVLEHSRWRHFGWAMFCLTLGGLLVLQLGAVGRFIGLLVLALGAYRSYRFIKTLLHPAGTISVTSEHVNLPLGLCHGESAHVAMDDISHIFFLRRSVPWFSSSPILVIEVGDEAHLFPRDWFQSEHEQERVAQAVRAMSEKHAHKNRNADKASASSDARKSGRAAEQS